MVSKTGRSLLTASGIHARRNLADRVDGSGTSSVHRAIDWTPSIEEFSLRFCTRFAGAVAAKTRLHVQIVLGDETLADESYALSNADIRKGELKRTIQFVDLFEQSELPDGSSDRLRERYFWHPNHPNLLEARITLVAEGETLDSVQSYAQLVKAETRDGRIYINNCRDNLRLVLDQGYWLDSGMTPPSDAALQEDIRLIKEAGFNGVRKHNKLEDPRFLYWCRQARTIRLGRAAECIQLHTEVDDALDQTVERSNRARP